MPSLLPLTVTPIELLSNNQRLLPLAPPNVNCPNIQYSKYLFNIFALQKWSPKVAAGLRGAVLPPCDRRSVREPASVRAAEKVVRTSTHVHRPSWAPGAGRGWRSKVGRPESGRSGSVNFASLERLGGDVGQEGATWGFPNSSDGYRSATRS